MKYDYVKTNQYKDSFRKCCLQCGLAFKINIYEVEPFELVNKSSSTAMLVKGQIVLVDTETAEATAYQCVSVGADSLDKQVSKAETLMIKDFIKGNFLIGDDTDDADDPEADVKAEPEKPKFIKPEERKEITKVVVEQVKEVAKEPTQLDKSYAYALKLLGKVRAKDDTFGVKALGVLQARAVKTEEEMRKIINRIEEKADELQID